MSANVNKLFFLANATVNMWNRLPYDQISTMEDEKLETCFSYLNDLLEVIDTLQTNRDTFLENISPQVEKAIYIINQVLSTWLGEIGKIKDYKFLIDSNRPKFFQFVWQGIEIQLTAIGELYVLLPDKPCSDCHFDTFYGCERNCNMVKNWLTKNEHCRRMERVINYYQNE